MFSLKFLKSLYFLLGLILLYYPAFPQNIPTLAILPLRTSGLVSEEESVTLTSLLETGLVKSTVYEVVERSNVDKVLEAQREYLQGYTAENSAIKIGKILAVEQIVLGSVSMIGRTFYITARIIDITSGRTLFAEEVHADTLEELAEKAELLGYQLAGIRVPDDMISDMSAVMEYGDLLVSTRPDNAEVSVNGRIHGNSPILVEKVPAGSCFIESKIEGMYGSQQIQLKKNELNKVEILLNRRLGRLFIRSSEPDLVVRLDDEIIGLLDDGIFQEIPDGSHLLELNGTGLYSSTEILIKPDETTMIDAALTRVGSLAYRIQVGASTMIDTSGMSRTISGSGIAEYLPTGDVTIRTMHPDYEPLEETVTIVQGHTATYSPSLTPTTKYLARLAHEAAERQSRIISAELKATHLEFEEKKELNRKLTLAGWIIYGISGTIMAGSGTSLVFFITTSDPESTGYSTHKYLGNLSMGLGIAGVVGFVLGNMVWMERPDLKFLANEIDQKEQEIEKLEMD